MTFLLAVMASWDWLGNPGFLALIGTLFGGTGLKMLESWLSRDARKDDKRRNLREEIAELVARIDNLEDDISVWRQRAFIAEEQTALLRVMVVNMGGHIPETLNTIMEKDRQAEKNKEP